MDRPLSAIIKDMAFTVLRRPDATPSSEAAHAALLFAHIAWNRRTDSATPDYRHMLGEFEASNPRLWDELTSRDPDELIAELATYREKHYRDDERYPVVCGMRDGKIHAEWIGEREHGF
jgi:hypothetical protein